MSHQRRRPSELLHPSLITRRARVAWVRLLGSIELTAAAKEVRLLFRAVGVYPTVDQIIDMVTWSASLEPDAITFGEFCLFAVELKRKARQRMLRPENSMIKDRIKMSSDHIDVFLDGRGSTECARLLKNAGVSCFRTFGEYSFRVRQIKNLAKVLVFVFSSDASDVMSAIVAAFSAALYMYKPVVFVFKNPNVEMQREKVPTDQELVEFEYLKCALESMAETRGIPVFYNKKKACAYIERLLRNNAKAFYKEHDLLEDHIVTLLKKVDDTFRWFGSEYLNARNTKKAIRTLTGVEVPVGQLKKIMSHYDIPSGDSEDISVDFDTFNILLAELNLKIANNNVAFGANLKPESFSSMVQLNRLRNRLNGVAVTASKIKVESDVYLGGSIVLKNDWRETIAMPHLSSLGYTFTTRRINDWMYLLSGDEAPTYVMPQGFKLDTSGFYDEYLMWSKVLLFVLDEKSGCVVQMTIAAHWMTLRPEAAVLCQMTLSEDAFPNWKSWNDIRSARLKLVNIAKTLQVPIFDNVQDALECVVSKLERKDY